MWFSYGAKRSQTGQPNMTYCTNPWDTHMNQKGKNHFEKTFTMQRVHAFILFHVLCAEMSRVILHHFPSCTQLCREQYKQYLGKLPELAGKGHKLRDQGLHCRWKLSLGTEITWANDGEDFVDGCVGGKSTVEDDKLSFQTLWDVIATSTRLNHSSQELLECKKRSTWYIWEIVKSDKYQWLLYHRVYCAPLLRF